MHKLAAQSCQAFSLLRATARPKRGIWALQGTIPAALAGLGKITQFVLNGNQLSGSIPAYLGGFPGLREAWVARNNLSGPLSPILCNGSFIETNIHLQVGSDLHHTSSGSQRLCLRSLSAVPLACALHLCLSGWYLLCDVLGTCRHPQHPPHAMRMSHACC